MQMLHEVLGIDDGDFDGDVAGGGGGGGDLRSARRKKRKPPPPKLNGGVIAAGIAFIEMISCWTEGMAVWLLGSASLIRLSDMVWARGDKCERGAFLEIAGCSAVRDAGYILAGALSCLFMAAALSLRYHLFFAMPTPILLRSMLGMPGSADDSGAAGGVKQGQRGGGRAISGTTRATCYLMCLGMFFQLWGQRAVRKNLFSADNFMDKGGGYSASRGLDIIIFAPLREVSLPPSPTPSTPFSWLDPWISFAAERSVVLHRRRRGGVAACQVCSARPSIAPKVPLWPPLRHCRRCCTGTLSCT